MARRRVPPPPPSRRLLLATVAALTAVMEAPALVYAAGGDGTGTGGGTGGTNATASTPTPSSGATPTPQGHGAGWFAVLGQLQDGEVELRSVRGGGSNWDSFCGGAPVVVTRSLSIAANGVCPDTWTNLSCTCVSELASPQSVWSFRVGKRDAQLPLVAPIPANTSVISSDSGGALVTVSTIGTFTVPSELTTLKLVGQSAAPLELRWDFNMPPGQLNSSVLVTSRGSSASLLRSVEVSNISLLSVDIGEDFLPPKLSAISLRNCGIKSLRRQFLSTHHPTLESLVLSGNALTNFESAMPAGGASVLKELDLSDNKLTSIPRDIFDLKNLTAVYLQGNPITNVSVAASAFVLASSLKTLRIDTVDPAALACTGGEWKTAAASGVRLCVLPDPEPSASSSSYSLYLAVGIPVCVLAIAVSWFLLRKRKPGKKQDSSSLSLIESTGSQDYPTLTVDAELLSNPLLLMNRIPYKEVLIQQCVNRGGFGVVYSGTYKNRTVAIKKIRSEFKTDVSRLEEFLHEICLVASLSHPRIVEFIGVAWDTLPNLSVVTEFMDRGDLREVLQSYKKTNRRLTWDAHKLRIALHVVEALAYLHSLVPTVIHRDLKSKNVLLSAALDAKLSDFGISREWTVDDTHMTVGIGTSFWIAPEVLLGKKYDERADVFSFGVVLSELDTDDYPYWGVNYGEEKLHESEILRLVAVGQVRPTFTPECPRAVLALADLCLQSDPEHRPTSAQIVNVLRHLLAYGSDSVRPSASSHSVSTTSVYDLFF